MVSSGATAPCRSLAGCWRIVSFRAVIAGATIAWGGFAALAAAATGWITMLLTRVGFGLVEGPIYPAGAKLIGMWMTPTERGRAAALLDGGAPLETALGSDHRRPDRRTSIVAGGVPGRRSRHHGLRRIRLVLRPQPSARAWLGQPGGAQPYPGRASSYRGKWERRCHAFRGVPFAVDLDAVRGLVLFQLALVGFLTWVPSFLAKTQGLNIAALGWASFLVFFAGFIGELAGGQLLDHWLRTDASPEKVYRRLFGISAGLATIAVFLVAYVHQEAAVITLLATTLFVLRWCGMYWTLPGLLIGGGKSGFLAGEMNFAGNISGIVGPVTVGLIVSATGSYYLALMVFAAAGAGLFLCSIGIHYRRAL